jgi:endonuclease/exonuclease/phosphatase family metal-dependent hydrolase
MLRRAALLSALLLLPGCWTGLTYANPAGPRYTGAVAAPATVPPDTFRIVTFNIRYALQVDSAIALLGTDSALYDADVILLQEMDEPGTKRIAQALGLGYIYYPATFHLTYRRDVGNAILSRWPILDDAKIILPHKSRILGTRRMATAATLRVGDTPVRVYSTHRGTVVGRLDHIFLKGLSVAAAGTVLQNRKASDHRPVWVRGLLR